MVEEAGRLVTAVLFFRPTGMKRMVLFRSVLMNAGAAAFAADPSGVGQAPADRRGKRFRNGAIATGDDVSAAPFGIHQDT